MTSASAGRLNPAPSLRFLEIGALVVILGLAAYLRLYNGGENPGWYSDEGTNINIAANLAEGRDQYFAIDQSMLLVARLPVFPCLLSGFFRRFGSDIGVLRAFTASLGVLSVALLYAAVRRGAGEAGAPLALLAAGLLAIYPQAVLYNRLGFNYNLLTPLNLLIFLGALDYLLAGRRRGVGMMAAALGIGLVSNLTMMTVIPPVLIIVLALRPRDLLWSIPLMLAPLGLYAGSMLIRAPDAFTFDLAFTLSRLNEVPVTVQGPLALMNYFYLLSREPWFAPAIIGLFLLRPARLRYAALALFLLPLLAISRTVGLNSVLGFYYLSPLLPFVALGAAALVFYGTPVVLRTTQDGVAYLLDHWGWEANTRMKGWVETRLRALAGGLGVFIILLSPLLVSTIFLFADVQDGYQTDLDPVLVDPRAAREVAAWVNSNSDPDQVVLASPAVAWLLHAQAADFQQALAADGLPTMHFPTDIPADRFVFDPRFEHASFVVIDGIWRNWGAVNMPAVARVMAEVEDWPQVFSSGDIAVYRNPREILR